MNATPISRRARRWRPWATPASSHSTTVDAPISMRLSKPKPGRATERAPKRSNGQHDDARHVPAESRHFENAARA